MIEKEKILEKMAKAIVDYDKEAALAATKEAVEAKIDPVEAIENGLSAGLKEVRERAASTTELGSVRCSFNAVWLQQEVTLSN